MMLLGSCGHGGHGGFGLGFLLLDGRHSEQKEQYAETWKWAMTNYERKMKCLAKGYMKAALEEKVNQF